uniref:G-protein alpha subunit n=1 Tax=Acrobeloides nanus TaxID=290746 RepID=A0A914CDK2_9BILA
MKKLFMGNCESSPADVRKRNHAIDREIEEDRRILDNTIKLLLLGAGESGKSTVLKQMKIIHDNGYTESEVLAKRPMVFVNVIQSMYSILTGMYKLKIPLSSKVAQDYARLIHGIVNKNAEMEAITEEIYTGIKTLLADKGVQMAIQRKDEYYLQESAQHFLDSIDRIYDPKYLPTQQDILLLRIATMGVIEVQFKMKNKLWRVFDVGGQRSQRKKWIHCFDDARAVIFVVAMSEYDQVLLEDNTTNRLQESLQLFKQVCNNKYFVETSIILFLNKKDLFAFKVGKGRSLRIAFPEFNGQETYDSCSKYIEKKFFMANEVPNKLSNDTKIIGIGCKVKKL